MCVCVCVSVCLCESGVHKMMTSLLLQVLRCTRAIHIARLLTTRALEVADSRASGAARGAAGDVAAAGGIGAGASRVDPACKNRNDARSASCDS